MKRKSLQPLPDTVWYSKGRVKNTTVLRATRKRLRDKAFLHWREFTPSAAEWWWGFDAAWRTDDGARVKARLELQPDLTVVKHKELTKGILDDANLTIDLNWRITAEADSSWQMDWPSPMIMLGPGTFDWLTGNLSLGNYTAMQLPAEQCQHVFSSLEEASSYITVITHDKRPVFDEIDLDREPQLKDYLPTSLQGRLVEIRVFGEQDRVVNAHEVLPESRLQLIRGGALILPTSPRQDAWGWGDYNVRRPPGGDMTQLLKETAESVIRYAELRPHYDNGIRRCVKDLRETWALPEIEVAPRRVLEEKEQAVGRARELEQQLTGLKKDLDISRRLGEEICQARDAALDQLDELRAQPLVQQAQEATEQAEEAWRALDAAETLTERLAAEVAWLRRERAQVAGLSYGDPAPEPQEGPASWAELVELTSELLPRVRIGEACKAAERLRGHEKEKVWLRRTWTALEAYQAYAEARTAHGPEVLPHMQAYLQWPQATALFPESWHAPSDSAILHREEKYKVMRTFYVPELGPVFMGEHIRIDHGRRPTPRMHVFDDSCGPTGLVHVGYIGPHLPDGRNDD
ncbi:hypothetical protein AB0E08_07690 [Streptomyces sp. NPDC048281]|uniref:hypothetical protein n=1 Tax=Streptomyces sp. NPDC048281 TaxID=3154715 RepID=UPI003418FB6A